ncbi:sensor domain-containing protein [Jeotgalibacillus salarius]|uniref:Bifunctional diguanylate cyclase/phosphodiesterase n=1 Tax=Jeotgalibacillus salarius TaxID=546023 RepID=A0A4Y8LCD1_9BACL|nr:bifunctional diguanylate cyclase/phosphodiesterase [Jeotgalibacillus salarius]TFE00320.1 bifunctional diguanylate cyclase/phosphodiesterase [Jeotgalibacillus salarius]
MDTPRLRSIEDGHVFSNEILDVLTVIITKHITDAVFIMEEVADEFTYRYTNQAALHLIRKSTEEVLGKTLPEVMGKDGFRLVDRYRNTKADYEHLRYRDSVNTDHGIKHFETNLTPISDQLTNSHYVVAVVRDVTDQENEKIKLEHLQQQYQSIIHHNLDAVLTLSDQGIIRSVNQAATKTFSVSEEKMIGQKITDLFSGGSSFNMTVGIEKALKEGPHEFHFVPATTAEGAAIVVHTKFVPIIANGRSQGVYLIVRDATSEKETKEKINFLYLHDSLTGLYNRQALNDHIDELSELTKDTHAVLCLDLDNFKKLNKTLGFNAGDELLKKVAGRLRSLVQEDDTLYRLNADEFVFLLKHTSHSALKGFAEEILTIFQQPFEINHQEYFVSASIGISVFPADGIHSDVLINHAAQALHTVKKAGITGYGFYHNQMNQAFPDKMIMETHLRRAIELDELSLHYQPQVDLNNGTITSIEALLRWNNRKFGSVPPSEFISIAEENGLIHPIGAWVIDQACLQLQRWALQGIGNIRVAVNISPKQFSQPDFDRVVSSALEKYGVDASLLEIEITESAMSNMNTTLNMLKKLKKIGVKISVDDFGTGYSSLNYLRLFPIDILKIDQSFVREIQSECKDAAITKTIIHLAHSLGLEVVAEGVEELAQVSFLRKEHCQKGQGYFFSKPLPSREMEKKLLNIG